MTNSRSRLWELNHLRKLTSLSALALPCGLASLALATVGCFPTNHPLDSAGQAQFLSDQRPVFASDSLDDAGNPVLPRQAPFRKDIQVYLTSAGAPDEGAYVDLQVNPPNALVLTATDETCEQLGGVFRCSAGNDGYANFEVASQSDWSGEAELRIVSRSETDTVRILPAGLPDTATNFVLTIEGVDGARVPARYNALECTLAPVPDQTFNKWPVGRTRVREAELRVTAPSISPGVVEYAPVIVESLHPEVYVTLDRTCPEPRTSRLRLLLDELGRSEKFYFCFSDLGGTNVRLAFSSGQKVGELVELRVDPEPRLLRVVTTSLGATVGTGSQPMVAISAFDADLKKVAFPVDITSSNPNVLAVDLASTILPVEGEDPKTIFATPRSPGTARLRFSPELYNLPLCESSDITVAPEVLP